MRGAKRRGNLGFSTTYKGRDCFASFAMTISLTFYDFIKYSVELPNGGLFFIILMPAVAAMARSTSLVARTGDLKIIEVNEVV